MAQYFALPISDSREKLIRQGRKRKRSDVSNSQHESGTPNSPPARSERKQTANFNADHLAQLRLAGLDIDENVPPFPFPHSSANEHTSYTTIVHGNLAGASRSSQRDLLRESSLRERHLSNLVTALHRCLLSGDYRRAEKAWSLLLRSSFAGNPIDLRSNGYWGIGAEVLLQKYAYIMASGNATHGCDGLIQQTKTFAEEGFKRAREYYERLILQYPFNAIHKKSVDATSFYPAMLKLWMFEVNENALNSVRALNERAQTRTRFEERLSFESHDVSEDSVNPEVHYTRTREIEIKKIELKGAQQIAARLDKLLSSPPLDDDPDILGMRAVVDIWIDDLKSFGAI